MRPTVVIPLGAELRLRCECGHSSGFRVRTNADRYVVCQGCGVVWELVNPVIQVRKVEA